MFFCHLHPAKTNLLFTGSFKPTYNSLFLDIDGIISKKRLANRKHSQCSKKDKFINSRLWLRWKRNISPLVFLPMYESKNEKNPKEWALAMIFFQNHCHLIENLLIIIGSKARKVLRKNCPLTLSAKDAPIKHQTYAKRITLVYCSFLMKNLVFANEDFHGNETFYLLGFPEFQCKNETLSATIFGKINNDCLWTKDR